MNIPTLRTPCLILRPWTPEDADRLFAILQEPNILRYFPRTEPWPREKVDKYIAHHLSHWQERGYGHWAAVHFGFTNCSLEKIIGLTHPENIASARVLEKCGLKLIDRKSLWGIELCRYEIEREEVIA